MEEEKVKKITVKKILKFIALGIIVFVYTTIIARSFMSCDSSLSDKIIADEAFQNAYIASPEEFEIRQYGMQNAYVRIAEGRMITFDKLYYIPLANQLQFTVKYNTDVTKLDLGGKSPFRIYLKDKDGNVFEDCYSELDTRFSYGYVRICFRGVTLEPKKILTVYIELTNGDGTYSPLTSYRIYNGDENFQKVAYKP